MSYVATDSGRRKPSVSWRVGLSLLLKPDCLDCLPGLLAWTACLDCLPASVKTGRLMYPYFLHPVSQRAPLLTSFFLLP
jgi:hypothetical protein